MASDAKPDCYETLGVPRTASADDIKKAYRKLALQCHPDRNPGDKAAEEKFKSLSEAYDILSDPDKRAAYDQYGHAAFQRGGGGGGFHDPFDLFNSVFGMGGILEQFFGGGSNHPGRGADLAYELEVTLEEAALETEKEIVYSRHEACHACGGSGAAPGAAPKRCPTCKGHGQVVANQGFFSVRRVCPSCGGRGSRVDKVCPACRGEGRQRQEMRVKVHIPAGVDTGARLRVTGHGEAGEAGEPAGDLYVLIHVKEHEHFKRHGDNLICELPLPFPVAVLGGRVEVPTLAGPEVLDIPAGTQPGTVLKVRHAGLPHLRSGIRGDLLVVTQVAVPKTLTAAQRQKLQDYAAARGDEETPKPSPGFLQKAREFIDHL